MPAASEARRPARPWCWSCSTSSPPPGCSAETADGPRPLPELRPPRRATRPGTATPPRSARRPPPPSRRSSRAGTPALPAGGLPRVVRATCSRCCPARATGCACSEEANASVPAALLPPPEEPRYYLSAAASGGSRLLAFDRARRRPTIWFKHVLMPHLPWIYLPSGKQLRRTAGAVRGVESTASAGYSTGPWSGCPTSATCSRWRAGQAVGRLIDQLKRTGHVRPGAARGAADHGVSFRLGRATDKR